MTTQLEERIVRSAREVDAQRTAASRTLRATAAAAARAGMTQRQIAQLMGRSQPEVRRLMHASAARDSAGRPRRWMTARSAADAITTELAAGDELMAFKMTIQARDHLRTLTDADDIAEWAIEPAPIRDRRFDTFLRAIARRTCIELGLPTPDWATPERLESEWVMTNLTSRYARTKRNTPTDLAALNIFVTENDLATA